MTALSTSEPGSEVKHGHGVFELKLIGAAFELTVARGQGGELPSAGEILGALNDAPVDSIFSAAVFTALRDMPAGPTTVAELDFPAEAAWIVKVAPSRMAAHVVPSPTAVATLTASDVRAALTAAGVTFGVSEEALASFGDGSPLAEPVLVARGHPPVQARQAEVEFLFETNPSIVPSEHDDGSIDYRSLIVQRFVEPGTPLARRTPAIEGENGHDVTGREIVVPAARDHPLSKHEGKGTEVQGELLIATQAGRPILANDRVEVLPFYDVKGDLDFSVGNIVFTGDVIIHGDVHPGFQVSATGTVTVHGIVDRATILAGGDVIARAITGDEHSHVESGNDVAVQYLHSAQVRAKGTVKVQREILHSRVGAARVETPSGGRIVGGHMSASAEVTTGVIGSVQATATHIEVGMLAGDHRPVIRAAKRVYFGSVLTVAHAQFTPDEDLGSSSFWAHEDLVVRLDASSTGPAAPAGR